MSSILIAILAGMGGMIGWGLADLFAKKTIDEIGDMTTLVWAHIFGTLFIAVIFLNQILFFSDSKNFNLSLKDWIIIVFFGILQGAVYLFVYKGFGKGLVAILNPIFASFTGLVALISILFLGEIISLGIIISLLTILFGVLLLSTDLESLKLKKINILHTPGSKEVFLATFLAAIWTILWNIFIDGKNWLFIASLMYVFMTLFIILISKLQNLKFEFPKKSAARYLMFIGAFEVIAYISISLGYSLTPHTSIIALVSGAFSLPTIILARRFLGEKISKWQSVGGFVVIVGIIILFLV
ncbi:MAG: DMT family transporter [bacterium]|nr:DMT family transporter [bacterium]